MSTRITLDGEVYIKPPESIEFAGVVYVRADHKPQGRKQRARVNWVELIRRHPGLTSSELGKLVGREKNEVGHVYALAKRGRVVRRVEGETSRFYPAESEAAE